MQVAITLTTDANAPVQYIDGQVEAVHPLSAADLAALPAGTRHVRKVAEPTPELAAVLVIRKARPRKVRFVGTGWKVQTAANGEKIVTPLRAVTVTAKVAASMLGLNAAESAAFIARFPSDGSAAPAPKDADTVSAVFRKVNGAKSRALTFGGATAEVLA